MLPRNTPPSDHQQASNTSKDAQASTGSASVSPPAIALPKGGGAIRGIGEKFAANPVTGTGSMSVPITTSPGRSGFGPQLSLSYDSGAANGPFGFGWSLSLPSITRKTDKGLPQYLDAEDSDVFILSGAEDLVPVLVQNAQGKWERESLPTRTVDGVTYQVHRYRPRIEGLFARIERWTNTTDATDAFWRSISKDNITTWYGKTADSRIADPGPDDPTRIFSWLISQSHDDKGNVVVYGYKREDSAQIFEDKAGNRLTKAHESNRTDESRSAQRYLKRIRYGNRSPYFPALKDDALWPEPPDAQTRDGSNSWHFEVVFDYGEHGATAPTPNDAGAWPARSDPFSSYRAGFEIRTYRICQRVLMFHHFPGEAGVERDCLVRSTDFTYSDEVDPAAVRNPVYTFLRSVTQTGYRRNNAGYDQRSLPPVEFEYSEPTVQDAVEEVDPASLENLPIGLDSTAYRWTDLHGEGIPGILTEQAGAWFYKRNLSPIPDKLLDGRERVKATFAPLETVALKPNVALISGAEFMDLAGDGQPDVVVMDGPTPGLYEHDEAESWQAFGPFTARLNRDFRDPNLKLVDLDGDGHADVLITEGDAFVWHASLAEEGFGSARRVAQALDEEKGPRIVFAEETQSIYLADLSGDGLADIVRIRNGEVCYWPNLGYGCFGAKVTMDNAPWFDQLDQFDQKRIRLADIDGSGTTDIIYLHRDGVRLYFNQSGNSWSQPHHLRVFPRVDDLVSIVPTDLLANGTACLVWSSPLPGDARRPMRYVNLMGGQKPHLLVKTVNNLGAETRVEYAPSTRFYLQDKRDGKPWITRLPFPVHVVERVTVTDTWRKTSFSSSYSYHHGYFDGSEREFRGFGRVEQIDVEDYGTFAAGNTSSPYITDDKTLYQPPVKTVTWFHTGAFLDAERILGQLAHEYVSQRFDKSVFEEKTLSDPDLAAQNLSADEWPEALRACKGMPLRQEIYELDVDALARGEDKPVKLFSAVQHSCHIQRVQPRADNRHAAFHVTESEAITYHYELDLRSDKLAPDPRIAHTLNLKVDEYGNIQQAVTVGYPRWQALSANDPLIDADANELIASVQRELHLAYVETRYTGDWPPAAPAQPDPDNYRLRLPCEVQTYELTGITTTNAGDGHYVALDKLRGLRLSKRYPADGNTPVEVDLIAYHQLPNRTKAQKRLVEHTRALFFRDDLINPLPLGTLNARALPYESYTLGLTTELLTTIFGDKLTPDVVTTLNSKPTSGYLSGPVLMQRLGDDTAGQYWCCAGIASYNARASQNFFLPERYIDPFGNVILLDYDPRALYVRLSTDALGNRTEVVAFDFRVMAPRQIQDINGNRSEVRFDVLGMPMVMALSGKNGEGDTLNGFDDAALNPERAALISFFVTDEYSPALAKGFLGTATARHLYYFGETVEKRADGTTVMHWGQHPACACGIVREQHSAQQPDSPVQAAFEYSDGGGSVLVQKVQAEPKLPNGPLRWVVSGKTILNNKGKPVKQYEPYFSPSTIGHHFEEPQEIGVTPIIYYDAAGRVIRTESPDGSFSRVEFSPWQVKSFDANDTVLESRWYRERLTAAERGVPLYEPGATAVSIAEAQAAEAIATTALAMEKRAARLARDHADTPAETILDSLGREVIAIAHNRTNGVDEKYLTFSKLDAEGKPLWVQDARGNRVMQYITPIKPARAADEPDPANPEHVPEHTAPCYDIAGNLLFQHSMDSGERWMLNDAAGKPLFAWNSRGFRSRVEYDTLHRPTGIFVQVAGDTTLVGAPRNAALPPAREVLVEKWVYGENHPDASANLRGRPYRVYDSAGVATSARYDFKGNLLTGNRRFARDYKTIPDWIALAKLTILSEIASAAEPLLEPTPPRITQTTYDALNRPLRVTTPDNSVYQPSYNAANLLARVYVWLPGAAAATPFVTNIDYDAKGQRVLIVYGNRATTGYDYDPFTFRLIGLQTTRPANPDATASLLFKSPTVVQDLRYTYDPVGNITRIEDAALRSTAQAGTACDYAYDALYRLLAASGREHSGQTDFAFGPADGSYRDYPFVGHRIHPNDLQGLRGYVARYTYDAVGNIMQLAHHAGGDVDRPDHALWRRRYQYALDSNRLLATSLPGDPDNLPEYVDVPSYRARYGYDVHGNIASMSHLPLMRWDFRDQLSASAQQVVNNGTPETTYYVYDAAGQRARKVTETQSGARKSERLYLRSYEIYREYSGGEVALERQTLHILDDKQRIALVETESAPAVASRIRYQFGNHLGSASVELDSGGALIAYEEYHPYGTSAFQAGPSAAEVSLKRYRYTGKERDDETGFSYHGARYYAPWLGRWVSCDPIGIGDGLDIYAYARCNPVRYIDELGTQCMQSITVGNENQALSQCSPDAYEGGSVPKASFSGPSSVKQRSGGTSTSAPATKQAPKSNTKAVTPVFEQLPPPEPDHALGFYPVKEASEHLGKQAANDFKEGSYLKGLAKSYLQSKLSEAVLVEDLMPYNIPDHFLAAGQYAKRWVWYSMRGQSGKGLWELGKGHLQAASIVASVSILEAGFSKAIGPTVVELEPSLQPGALAENPMNLPSPKALDPTIPDFNPGGYKTNCARVTLKMDRWLGGSRDTSPVGNLSNVWLEEIEEALPNKFYDSTTDEVQKALQSHGAGARGVLAWGKGNDSHIVNVVNWNGKIIAIDGQNMTYGSIRDVITNSGYGKGILKFMFTYIP